MKLYIQAAIAKYEKPCTIYYGDGNSSASRGNEPEHISELRGYACSPEMALVAALNADILENGFTSKDILDAILDDDEWDQEYFEFDDPEDFSVEEINSKGIDFWISKIYDIDLGGGYPYPYKVEFNNQVIFHDKVTEENLLPDAVRTPEQETAWYLRKREENYRLGLAHHSDDAEILDDLANDGSFEIKSLVCVNPNVSNKTLLKLYYSQNSTISYMAGNRLKERGVI